MFGLGKKELDEPAEVSALHADERTMLQYRYASFYALLDGAGLEFGEDDVPAEVCDRPVGWWRAEPEGSRPDANDVVWSVGVMLGESLRDQSRVEWRLLEDAFGTSISLVCERPEGDFILSPIDSVAKRFAGEPDGFVSKFFWGSWT